MGRSSSSPHNRGKLPTDTCPCRTTPTPSPRPFSEFCLIYPHAIYIGTKCPIRYVSRRFSQQAPAIQRFCLEVECADGIGSEINGPLPHCHSPLATKNTSYGLDYFCGYPVQKMPSVVRIYIYIYNMYIFISVLVPSNMQDVYDSDT